MEKNKANPQKHKKFFSQNITSRIQRKIRETKKASHAEVFALGNKTGTAFFVYYRASTIGGRGK
jgi:hypothetical protein